MRRSKGRRGMIIESFMFALGLGLGYSAATLILGRSVFICCLMMLLLPVFIFCVWQTRSDNSRSFLQTYYLSLRSFNEKWPWPFVDTLQPTFACEKRRDIIAL